MIVTCLLLASVALVSGRTRSPHVPAVEQSDITVLTQVWLLDGSRYEFNYASWGQVNRMRPQPTLQHN